VSPTIRIDDEVFAELKKHAEPFVDTPNSVIRRLLKLGAAGPAVGDGTSEVELEGVVGAPRGEQDRARVVRQRRRRAKATRRPRAKTGSILWESAHELATRAIISENGGRAAAREVLDELETRLDGQLTEVDREQLSSGDLRWRNRAQFVRLRLVEQGDMVKDSPRGIWEISEQGRRRIAADAS
jgi:hypothetical protein